MMRSTADAFDGRAAGRQLVFQPLEAAIEVIDAIHHGLAFGDKPGEPHPDPYFLGQGPPRSSCVGCGGCMVGCRFNAKNTLDKNYLYFAEKRGAQVLAETRVVALRPLDATGAAGYELTLEQHTAPTPGQPHKRALPIPVAIALFDAAGRALPLRLDGEDADTAAHERVLLLDRDAATFRFADIDEAPTPSLLRGFSAPVRLVQDTPPPALAALARHDSDGFNRWFAGDALVRRLFAQALAGSEPDAALFAAWTACVGSALDDPGVDPALAAEMLTIADATSLADGLADIDPEAVHQALAAKEVYEFLGSPEGELAIAQAVVYMATAPKSNAVYRAFPAAKRAAEAHGSLMPPAHILNAPTKMMKNLGYGAGYNYDHDAEDGFSGQNYFPDAMAREQFYVPKETGFEREIAKRLEYWSKLRAKRSGD